MSRTLSSASRAESLSMNHSGHYASHYRSLFRAILRGIRKAKSVSPKLERVRHPDNLVQQEIDRSAIDPELYHRHLFAELRHLTWEEFSKSHKHLEDVALLSRLRRGQDLVDILQHIERLPEDSQGWSRLIEAIVEYKCHQSKISDWRQQYEENKSSIEQSRHKELPTLVVKRIISREQKNQKTNRRYSALSASQKAKAYDKILLESKENASFVVRNYIKRMQLMGKLPNPFKLPYVRPKVLAQGPNLPQTSEILPGSTKLAVLKEAYDMEYVDSILKHEIEFRINESHFLKKYTGLVNEKGPYKVQIRSTMSGIMPAHYLKLPYPQLRQLKALAMDIKRSTRSITKQLIWKLDPAATSSINVKRYGEGYTVRGSGGYSIEEIMFPKFYYGKLAAEEAAWDFRMEMLRLESNWNKIKNHSSLDRKLKLLLEKIHESWEEPLEFATREINDEVSQYYEKYRISKESKIWDRRKSLQSKMNAKHIKLIKKLQRLRSILRKNQVHMHSDLFRLNKSKRMPYDARIIAEEKLRPKERRGIPERPTSGLGYTLGDYMAQVGLSGYRMGEKFDKRLNFVRSGAKDTEKGN